MTLTYKRKNGQSNVVKVPFKPPLSGYDEVKPRLLGMKAEAQEALGMVCPIQRPLTILSDREYHAQIKAPQITTFHLPLSVWRLGVLIALLVYCTLAGTAYSASPLFAPGRQLVGAVGGWVTVKISWWILGVAHSLEALYTTSLVWRHNAPFPVAVSVLWLVA